MTLTRTGALLSAILLLGGGGTLAAASPSDLPGLAPGQVREVLAANPGLTESLLLEDARAYARSSGERLDRVLADVAADAHAAITAPPHPLTGGGGGVLAPGRRSGDMWYQEGVPGHIGLYTDGDTVVEAPGPSRPSHHVRRDTVRVPSGSHRITTVKSAGVQAIAARYAVAHLVGLPYNLAFWNNRGTHHPRSVNCSQLVWIAYDAAVALDLDGNGGPGVYPWDIFRSGYTVEYR